MGKVKREYIFKSNDKAKRQTRSDRDKIIEGLQERVGDFPFLYIVSYLRAAHVKKFKLLIQDHSVLSMCKNSLSRVMMERMSNDFQGLDGLIPFLKGQVFLVFSQTNPEKMNEITEKFFENDVPVSGSKSPSTLVLKEGPVPGFRWYDEEFFAINSIPIQIRNRQLHVTRDFQVCKKDEVLTDLQIKILNKLSHSPVSDDPTFPWVSFKFKVMAAWNRDSGKIEEF